MTHAPRPDTTTARPVAVHAAKPQQRHQARSIEASWASSRVRWQDDYMEVRQLMYDDSGVLAALFGAVLPEFSELLVDVNDQHRSSRIRSRSRSDPGSPPSRPGWPGAFRCNLQQVA